MIRRFLCWMLLAMVVASPVFAQKNKKKGGVALEYVVLASAKVVQDVAWNRVVEALKEKHQATVLTYNQAPRELLGELQQLRPRYVAIVEQPEQVGRDYIIDMHKVSREVDEDIYADFLWGVITGYDADAAMKMLNNSTEPLLIKDAVCTIMELHSAKWFDHYAWVDDHTPGLWGEKTGKDQTVTTGNIPREQVLRKFTDLYARYNPDLVVTAAHATENNLEMPFSLGNIRAKGGKLYADDRFTREIWDLKESGKRKVYFAVGNCLIGNVNNTRESMAVAWMNSGNAATMIGYVVTTWHGRNGWGGLKYWLTTPGRYSLAEAIYLNQQDLVYQLNAWNPGFLTSDYPFKNDFYSAMSGAGKQAADLLGQKPTNDQIGFWHDRDVLAYYGDPKWNVRLRQIPEENDYTVTAQQKGKKHIITIETKANFNMERMAGDDFKKEHVLDIPFSYFFPERLKNPKLASGQNWKVALDENFLLIYEPDFQPGQKYTVILETE